MAMGLSNFFSPSFNTGIADLYRPLNGFGFHLGLGKAQAKLQHRYETIEIKMIVYSDTEN